MHRLVKQVIYGSFYLLVISLLFFALWQQFFQPKLTCFDKIQNQDETGIDCGGPCQICVLSQIEPLQQIGAVRLFTLGSGQIVLLAEVRNQNNNYNASEISYRFLIHDQSNNLLDTVSGVESIYAGLSKYFYAAHVAPLGPDIAWVSLEMSTPKWRPVQDYSIRPNLKIAAFKSEIDDDVFKVMGSVRNESPVIAEGVKINALIFDRIGVELFAAQTFIAKIGSGEELPFTIYFPHDAGLVSKVDPGATEIFVSSSF